MDRSGRGRCDATASFRDLSGFWSRWTSGRSFATSTWMSYAARSAGRSPKGPTAARDVIADLNRQAEPGVTRMPSGRWFGFVLGGSLPVALAADWLTAAWDQNAGLFEPAPAAGVVEEFAGEWMRELFELPGETSFGSSPAARWRT